MEQVNTLSSGESFGKDSLLENSDLRRNATIAVLSEKVIVATLSKNDFHRVLFEQERQKTDLKIS